MFEMLFLLAMLATVSLFALAIVDKVSPDLTVYVFALAVIAPRPKKPKIIAKDNKFFLIINNHLLKFN